MLGVEGVSETGGFTGQTSRGRRQVRLLPLPALISRLKPVKMRGVVSNGMLLCASSKEGKDGGIETVVPPPGSQPGDKIFFEGFEGKGFQTSQAR